MDVNEQEPRESHRHALLHAAYRSQDVRAMEQPLLAHGAPLMRMAAGAVARVAVQMLDDEDVDIEDADIVLLAGAGDNGGDGLFAAALLAGQGAHVTCIAVSQSLHEAGFAALMRAGGSVLVLDPAAAIPGCESGFTPGEAGERLRTAVDLAQEAHLVIDAMTGIGIHGALRGLPGTVAALLGVRPDAHGHVELPDQPALPNRESAGDLPLVLAVDVPSGIGVDDGTLPGPVIPADVTVMMGAMKPCAMLPPATFACGRTVLVDFDFALCDCSPAALAVDDEMAAEAVRLPRVADTKYSRGVVGLVTGSERYPGAAVLTATAAARANVGMVRYLGPERAQQMVLAALPEAVMGKGHVQAWAAGSGVPTGDSTGKDEDLQRETIARLLAHYALPETDEPEEELSAYDMPPIVVDAGALDLLPARVPPQVVLTPHAGELARLVNLLEADTAGTRGAHAADGRQAVCAADVQDEPLRYAQYVASVTGATVLVKGAATLIVSPEHAMPGDAAADEQGTPAPVLVCGAAPAWLSTAGAGDVLAGTIGALLAQNADDMDEFDAAGIARTVAAGAYLHGQAAALASESEQHGWQCPELFGTQQTLSFSSLGHPVIASDVVRALPDACADLIA